MKQPFLYLYFTIYIKKILYINNMGLKKNKKKVILYKHKIKQKYSKRYYVMYIVKEINFK